LNTELSTEPEQIIHLAVKLERARLVGLKPANREEAERVPETLAALAAAAAADGHPVIGPTHVMVKGEKIIGYLSLGGLPTVQAWFDRKHPHAADSLKMIETGEALLQDKGVREYAVACAPESPFTPHMERMGFERLGETVLWLKRI
jgi:hypothetical protein